MVRNRRSGTSLIEVMVVVAIIAVLVALLLPAMVQARASARRSQCRNNLHQLVIAAGNYIDSFGSLPPGWIGAAEGKHAAAGPSGVGWGTLMLPMLEQQNLSEQFSAVKSVDDPANRMVMEVQIPTFLCPSDRSSHDRSAMPSSQRVAISPSSYVGVFGTTSPDMCANEPGSAPVAANGQCRGEGVFSHNSLVAPRHITDGLSNTFLIGERASDPKSGIWSTWTGVFPRVNKPFSRVVGSTTAGPNAHGDASAFSSAHAGGALFGFVDGHIRMVSDEIDPAVFKALSSYAGAELVVEQF